MADTTSATPAQTNTVAAPPAPSSGAASKTQAPATAPSAPGAQASSSTVLGETAVAATEFAVSWPEGLRVSESARENFTKLFKESGLKSEHAQALVESYRASQEAADKELVAQMQAEQKSRVEAIRNDKDFGGQKFEASKNLARKALAAFGDAELMEAFKDSTYGDHPALFRLLARVGQKLGEDSTAGTSAPNLTKETQEQVLRSMYPKSHTKG